MKEIEGFLSKINETDVNWKNISIGVDKYLSIMNDLHEVNVSSTKGESFRKRYCNFYRMNRRSIEFKKSYFKIFENFKIKNTDDFDLVLDKIAETNNRIEASFSSKMIASINANKPLWDSIILSNLEIKLSKYSSSYERSVKIKQVYKELEGNYKNFLKTKSAKNWLNLFDKKIGKTSISNTKKIDFIIWQTNR